MLPALILLDMLALSLEILLTLWGALALVIVSAVFAGVRALLGAAMLGSVALIALAGSALFIVTQAGGAAWSSDLMVYLLPSQIVLILAWVLVSLFAWTGMLRGRA